ncbi:hypothetical protein HPB51_029037 [Rhipicephalus microplus]|uniref:Tick transposon n=1 Tax=Rhipicephalus microplus TaxID=6941 RepID=A0A9J6CVN7_RHIMP|nr:hypothetical protein HPB51_029037 [Rhipicephalus microplus]
MELTSTLGLTLHTDPAYPTRVGNSVTRDTRLDLSFTKNIRHADWANTKETLCSNHCILNIIVTTTPLPRSLDEKLHPCVLSSSGRATGKTSRPSPPTRLDKVPQKLQQSGSDTRNRLPRIVTRIGYPPSIDGNSSSTLRGYARGRQPPPSPLAGSENAELDQPFGLHDLKAALAKMKRGTETGRDKVTVKILANLADQAYDALLAHINTIWLG